MKEADTLLVAALVFCVFAGLAFLVFPLKAYLQHDLLNDWAYDKPVPIAVYHPLFQATQGIVYRLFPLVAVGFFGVGYAIWNYRRKRGKLTPNTSLEPTASPPSAEARADTHACDSSRRGSAFGR